MREWIAITLILGGCAGSKAEQQTQEPLVAPSAEKAEPSDETTGEVGQAPPKDPELTGTLAKEEIRSVMRAAQNKFRYCYEKELVNDASLAGQIKVRFVIQPDGRVADGAEVTEATLDNRSVQSCLLARIEGLEFPEPEGGGSVAVNYPFNFKSTE